MTQGRDVVEAIEHDHREVEELFARYESATDPQERKDVVDQAIIELVRHSVGEEEYVYPVAKRALPNGGEVIEHEIHEHAEAEKLMNTLDGMAPGDERFDPTVRKLMAAIREHVQEEETQVLAQLRSSLPHEELLALGEKFATAKKLAPTRPHPMAPDHPPFNKLAAPGAALVDRVRDWLTGRGTE